MTGPGTTTTANEQDRKKCSIEIKTIADHYQIGSPNWPFQLSIKFYYILFYFLKTESKLKLITIGSMNTIKNCNIKLIVNLFFARVIYVLLKNRAQRKLPKLFVKFIGSNWNNFILKLLVFVRHLKMWNNQFNELRNLVLKNFNRTRGAI